MVANMHSGMNCFFPETKGHTSGMKYRFCSFNKHTIHAFSFTILLRYVWCGAIMNDPKFLDIHLKSVRYVLAAIVRLQSLDLGTKVYFNHGFELLELLLLLVLAFKGKEPDGVRVVVDVSDKEAIAGD